MSETTTIEVKKTTKKNLHTLKLCERESYDNVINRLLHKGEPK